MPTFIAGAFLTGRLITAGLACGLNLYATIAVLGLGSRLGWIELPPGLVGLEQWLIIGAAGILFVVGIIASTMPFLDAFWESAHTVVRPIGAGALAFIAIEGAPWSLRLAAALVTASAAFASHAAKFGLRIVQARRRASRLAIKLGEDMVAVGLAALAIGFPRAALAAAGGGAIVLAIAGPPLWRAFSFALRAGLAAVRGFFGTPRWLPGNDLPATIRGHIRSPEVGIADPKAMRASLASPAVGAWRNGWLVVDSRSAVFLYRKGFRTREITLPRPDQADLLRRPLADTIAWQHDDDTWSLHLLRDGPSAEITLGALQLAIR